MKGIFTIILLTFFIFKTQSQSKKHFYADEKYNDISQEEFNRKVTSDLFLTVSLENDTVVINKLRFVNYFGDLGSKKKSQLNKLFHKRFQIDSTKVWLIYYQDTLPNLKVIKNKNTYAILKYKKKHGLADRLIVIDEFGHYIHSETKKYKKLKNVSLLYFYEGNKGYPLKRNKIRRYKDYNSILTRTFTDGMRMYKYIIVHPNGNFNLSSYVKSFSENRMLLELKSFKEMEENWIMLHEKLN